MHQPPQPPKQSWVLARQTNSLQHKCKSSLCVFLWTITFLKMILHKNPTMVNLYQISSIVLHRVCCVATKLKKSDHIMLIFDLSDDNLRVEVHSSLILRSWLPVGGLVITWSPSTNWSVSIAAQGLLEKLSVTDILWSDAHTLTHWSKLSSAVIVRFCENLKLSGTQGT